MKFFKHFRKKRTSKKSKIKVFNLNSHYYCNLIEESISKNIEYELIEDFDIKSIFFSKTSIKKIHGWGQSKNINFFKICLLLIKNSPIFTFRKTYLICHRIFDHFFFTLLAILVGVKPICIFHGRCENSSIKFIYRMKFLISKIYYYLEKKNLLKRYFIHPQSKFSYFGETGITQKPAVINSSGLIAKYSPNSKCILVGNYPERPYFSDKILHQILKNNNDFSFFGASNKYNIKSLGRNDLLKAYKESFAYISILVKPEVHYSLTLLDACDVGLPILCLQHPSMDDYFKKHVLIFSSFFELEKKIHEIRTNQSRWDYYSKKSRNLLIDYFSKNTFINTWKDLIK